MYNADAHVILETPTESGVEYTYIFVGSDAWPMEEECSVFEVLETEKYIIVTEHFPIERRKDNNG